MMDDQGAGYVLLFPAEFLGVSDSELAPVVTQYNLGEPTEALIETAEIVFLVEDVVAIKAERPVALRVLISDQEVDEFPGFDPVELVVDRLTKHEVAIGVIQTVGQEIVILEVHIVLSGNKGGQLRRQFRRVAFRDADGAGIDLGDLGIDPADVG